MNKTLVAIVLGGTIIETLIVEFRGPSNLLDRVFDYIDDKYGSLDKFEFCDLSNPRHVLLFEPELKQLFKNK